MKRIASLLFAFFLLPGCEEADPADPFPMDPDLRATLEARLTGDRTHACVAAAVIDTDVRRAVVCADGGTRGITSSSAFEIGSISKTMTGSLLADLVARGELSLDDTLASHLPEGTAVPSFGGEPIRLVHVVTHTSGLPTIPSRMQGDPLNPYAALTEEVLLGSLADVTLTSAPGTKWAYSNFGFMLLSYVVTRTAGAPLETLVHDRLFAPLGMEQAFISSAPEGTERVVGHRSTAERTPPWDFPDRMAGVGGVRASLDDMIAYARAALGQGDTDVVARIERALAPIDLPHDGPRMGMAWVLLDEGGHNVAAHDGGTGGFSSLLIVDRERGRAVVLLLDTSFGSLGDDLGLLGFHLLDEESVALEAPRTVVPAPDDLLDALAGRYAAGDFLITLERKRDTLRAHVSGSGALTLRYDRQGDFFSSALDGVLTPVLLPDGGYTFDLDVGGAVFRGERLP